MKISDNKKSQRNNGDDNGESVDAANQKTVAGVSFMRGKRRASARRKISSAGSIFGWRCDHRATLSSLSCAARAAVVDVSFRQKAAGNQCHQQWRLSDRASRARSGVKTQMRDAIGMRHQWYMSAYDERDKRGDGVAPVAGIAAWRCVARQRMLYNRANAGEKR